MLPKEPVDGKHLFNPEQLVAGIAGGLCASFVLHPLELMKIKLAVNNNSMAFKGELTKTFLSVYRSEGPKGLYRGLVPNCVGTSIAWGLFFFFFDSLKSFTLAEHPNKEHLSAGWHMLLAAEAGIATLVFTNPIWVAKTKLCLQTKDSEIYKSFPNTLHQIYNKHGIRGLYRGFIPGTFGVAHPACQFMLYEEMKKFYVKYYSIQASPHNVQWNTATYVLFAASSKILSSMITYPYQVLRVRLQVTPPGVSVLRLIHSTWKMEGIRGFYKGMFTYILQVTPNVCILLGVYETVLAISKKIKNE